MKDKKKDWIKNYSLLFNKTFTQRKNYIIWDFKNLEIKIVNFRMRFLKISRRISYPSLWKLLFWLNQQTDLHLRKYTHTKRKLLIQWRCSPKELFFDSVFSWVWKGNFPPWLEAWKRAKVNTHVNTKQLGKIHSESVGSHEQNGIY